MICLPNITALEGVLDAAIEVDAAVAGCIQVIDEESHGRAIRVILERGLTPEYFERYRIVRSGYSTSCAQAFAERRRIVIRDVRTDPAYGELRDIAEAAGYLAVQTTPLIDADGRFQGLLSTYWDKPHHPGPESLAAIDRCAEAAMLLMQAHWLNELVRAADDRVRIHDRLLPSRAVHAAKEATRAFLAPMDMELAIDHLRTIVGELRPLTKKRALSAMSQHPLGRGRGVTN